MACVRMCAYVHLFVLFYAVVLMCVWCAHASVPVRAYIRAGVRGFMSMYVRDGSYMCICVHICAFVCVSMCMRIGVRVCACVCACV